jgi:hypothetical protein
MLWHTRASKQLQQGQLCLCQWILCLLLFTSRTATEQSCAADACSAEDAPAAHAASGAAQHDAAQQTAASSIFIASVTMTNGGGNVIKDALLSVVDWVDACILLDTGITDNTVEIARETAGNKLLLQKLPWPGSFAEARNAALDAAAAAGAQWAIILDTDERIRCSAVAAGEGHDAGCRSLVKYLQGSNAAMINMLHESATYHKVGAAPEPCA